MDRHLKQSTNFGRDSKDGDQTPETSNVEQSTKFDSMRHEKHVYRSVRWLQNNLGQETTRHRHLRAMRWLVLHLS